MITLQKSNQLKSIAILMMLCLHLFNRDYHGLFQPVIFIAGKPLSYYVSLFCDACVPIFAFVSGYGLYFNFTRKKETYVSGNKKRIKNLYLNYWVVLLVFPVLLGLLLNKQHYPGTVSELLQNISGLNPTYNGAWWFFTVYVFFVLSCSFWFKILDRINPYLYLASLFLVYLVGFYFRIYREPHFNNGLLQWATHYSILYFCTLFQFMLGAFALRYRWNDKVTAIFSKIKYKNAVVVLGVIVLVIAHAIIPNFIVAPFTGLAFIFLFLQIGLPTFVDRALDFLVPHSTNL